MEQDLPIAPVSGKSIRTDPFLPRPATSSGGPGAGSAPSAREEFLRSRSPLFKADQIKAPLLIGQGANDPRVKRAESDQIVAAMRRNGKAVEYLLFPDKGHGFARPENRLKWHAAAEAFLAKYLGGRVEPASERERWESLRQ